LHIAHQTPYQHVVVHPFKECLDIQSTTQARPSRAYAVDARALTAGVHKMDGRLTTDPLNGESGALWCGTHYTNLFYIQILIELLCVYEV